MTPDAPIQTIHLMVRDREQKQQSWPPASFDREQIRCWLEDATGVGLSVEDPLPDTLAATAEGLGMKPAALLLWVHDQPAHPWTPQHLTTWAIRFGFASADSKQGGGA